MIRQQRWTAVGGQLENLRDGYEDFEFWVRILRDGGVARRTPTPYFHYRVHPTSRTFSISHGGVQRTQQAIIDANPERHRQLLTAAFTRMDQLNREKVYYVAYVRQWKRRTRWLILSRNKLRSLRASLDPTQNINRKNN